MQQVLRFDVIERGNGVDSVINARFDDADNVKGIASMGTPLWRDFVASALRLLGIQDGGDVWRGAYVKAGPGWLQCAAWKDQLP